MNDFSDSKFLFKNMKEKVEFSPEKYLNLKGFTKLFQQRETHKLGKVVFTKSRPNFQAPCEIQIKKPEKSSIFRPNFLID